MTTRTLRLRIESEFAGKQALSTFNEALKDSEATLGKFVTVTKIADDGTKAYTHTVEAQTKSLRDRNKVLREGVRLSREGSSTTSRQTLQDPEKVLREKERLAQSFDTIRLKKAKDLIRLKTLAEKHGASSIEAFRESQRQREVSRETRLQKTLAGIRTKFASGELNLLQQQIQRNKAILAYESSILSIKKATLIANQKNEASQKRITSATKNTSSAQKRVLSGTRSVIRANRSWTLQIAEGIGLYRTVSFLLHTISRAILAIPKIGIERQTTEAVFESTLGGGAGSAAAFKALSLEAERTGIAITTLRETFRNLNASMSLAGETTKTVWQVFSNINTVSTALHLSGEKTSNVFNAIAQIFNKSKVQSEELVKQLGNLLPGAFASFQKANEKAFKNSQALSKAMQDGIVRAHVTVENFTEYMATRFATAFAVASTGLQANLGRLETSFTELGESIFAVIKGPMLSVVKSLTSIAKGLKEAVDGTGALGAALEQLGTLVIVAVTLKMFSLVKAFSAILTTSAILANRFTSITKVGLSVWALFAVKAVKKLGTAFKFLGGWPAVIVLGLAEVIGYLINLGQEARDAADRVNEIWKEREKLKNQGEAKQIISIDVQVKNAKEVLEAKNNLVEVATAYRDLLSVREQARNVGASFFGTAELNKAKTTYEKALIEYQEITKSTRDIVEAEQSRQATALAALDKEALDIKAKKEIKNQKLIAGIQSEAIAIELSELEVKHTKKIISDKNYFIEKEKLLLEDLETQRVIAKEEQALVDINDTEGLLKSELKLKKLEARVVDVKARIEKERLSVEKRNARVDPRIRKEEAFRRVLEGINLEYLKMTGNLEELAKIEAERFRKRIESQVTASGGTLDAGTLRQLDAIESHKKRAVSLQAKENSLSLAHQKMEFTTLKLLKDKETALFFNKELSEQHLSAYDEIRTTQEDILEALNAELNIHPNNQEALERKLGIEQEIFETVQNTNVERDKINQKGIDDSVSALGGDKYSALNPSQVISDFGAINQESKLDAIDADVAYRKNALEDLKRAQEQYQVDITASEAKGTRSRLNAVGSYALGVMDLASEMAMTQTENAIKVYGAESKQAKKAFAQYKAIMIAKTIMATALAVMNIWGTTGIAFPVAIALTAVVAALGAVQIAQIAGQQMPAAHGGLDYVPKEETYLLDKGERVLSPNQNRDLTSFLSNGEGAKSSGQASQENVKIRIINNVDNDIFNEFLESDAGERVVMNIVKRNG